MIDTGDNLPDDITSKNVVILLTYVVENDGQCYPQLFLGEAS